MKKLPIFLSAAACAIGLVSAAPPASAMSLSTGTQSEHVLDLQERLDTLGYFDAGVTGYFGMKTAESVKKFQRAYGLPVDGEADSKTLGKLEKAAVPKQNALDQMARIIYSEARGESYQGQVAIGAVVINRVQSNQFPDSIPGVIHQPGQFSAIRDGQYWLKPNETAYKAARAALNGSDPTGGALFYYNPDVATSSWSKSRPRTAVIGNHVFTN
ncbi:cell wall hydrolase [Paenibacillus sp. UNC499MF]|uniref:cell wall hydrolase n=1 Tax=Paenibacillus sp. UNC499MF TaxID=1502751 RepID=UPI00089FB54D|nr:cell wall hydrolase [Paenibacillus sp. UNC499MF]SEG65257.1 N-acetylmuramoyl-L-alanine amidase [Paenibacillus sp. UNC499MF]